MSELLVTSIYNQEGEGAPSFPKGATVTGVITATSFSGSGANLTGIDATALKDDDGNVKIQANSTGVVLTGILTATGSVSVGGTLTYEDVTNIDSVGLITARSGVKVTSGGIDISGNIGLGGATYGTSGQVLTSGGSGANASWTTISSAPEFAGIASGSITGGKGVCVADDGKLMGVAGDLESRGVTTQLTDVSSDFAIVYHEAADRYVIFYRDVNYGDYGQARVGTHNGTSITWGAKQQFGTNSLNPSQIHAIYDSTNEKVVVLYRDNSASPGNTGTVMVGDISGNTLTLGTHVQGVTDASGGMEYSSFCYCPNTDHYAVSYNNSSGNKGYCRIGKYSGTNSSTWPNASVLFQNAQARGTGCFYDTTANKLIVMAHNAAVSNNLYIVCGTISGDAITFTSGVAYDTNNADGSRLTGVHDPSTGKNILCYGGGSYYGQCRTATLSGTTFTFGTPATFNADNTQNNVIAYGTDPNKFMISYWDQPTGDCYSVVASLSGSTITYDTPYLFQTNDAGNTATSGILYNSDSKQFVSLFRSLTQPAYFVEGIRISNATTANYVGIANASYTNGQTASIGLPGAVNTAVSGVIVGSKYYVLADGSLNATADSANIFAGQGIGANKLLIR